MARKISQTRTTVIVGFSAALALSIAFVAAQQLNLASATHVGNAAHADIVNSYAMGGATPYPMSCSPCPGSWIQPPGNTGTVSSASQREYIQPMMVWLEGYDDIDLRIKSPSGTYYYSQMTATNVENVKVSNPGGGTWTLYAKAYSISTLDDGGSGAAGIDYYTSAWETTPLP